MKLLFILAVCLVGINANKFTITNSGYYWRDWKVNETIPADAVPGGVSKTGHKTFIARTIYSKRGEMVPGKADPSKQKMWFEYDNTVFESTEDVSILCSLNHNRFHWVLTKMNDLISDVERDGKVLVIGGNNKSKPVGIGRTTIGTEVQVGKVLMSDYTQQLLDLRVTDDYIGWGISKSYEVLVYDKTPDKSANAIIQFSVND